jgi:hypothetical protein
MDDSILIAFLVFVGIYAFAKQEVVMREVGKKAVLGVMIDVLKMERKVENAETSCGVCREKSRQRQNCSYVRVNGADHNA